ncbi:MAG: HAD family phosphatase [Gemmataceae bacterium]|nr:HAD family phosphatase [Gemmataceae bacterium]
MPIKTLVFDFGNVVAFFDHGRAIARLDEYTDVDPVELALVLYGSPIEDAYERGAIDTAEYVREGKLNGRLTCSDAQFLSAFAGIFWRNDEVCDLVPKLKPAYRLVLASNTTPAHFDAYARQFADTLGHFDFLGTSFGVRARKPEPEFFSRLQEHTNAEPGECLFLDDLPTNVAAAERFGWKGLVYRADGTLADKLRAAGVGG